MGLIDIIKTTDEWNTIPPKPPLIGRGSNKSIIEIIFLLAYQKQTTPKEIYEKLWNEILN